MERLKNIQFRKQKLKELLHYIQSHESEIIDALYKDFKKSEFEAYATEIAIVYDDLKYTIQNIERWARPKNVLPSILNFPSKDIIYSEPYGKVLVISPWNYPFQLAMCPIIGAFVAGNKVTLKPSELTPYTSSLISKIIREVFEAKHIVAILGDQSIAQNLLEQRWDYIFFTGSVTTGKLIYKAAAKNLTPVTLELGGKNPCIIDASANIKLAAKRITWGKFLNAGQTCIAPDYILVHESVKSELIACLQNEIVAAYTQAPEKSSDYPRIINKNHFERLTGLLENQNIIHGGASNDFDFYIEPTLVDEPNLQSKLMKDEIFGPILPIISYSENTDIHKVISNYEKPLALYYFTTNNDSAENIIKQFSFGGGCINDVIMQFSNKRLPFGGVGHSGIGAYHGKRTFDLFSHKKAIVKKANWLDIPFRYAPYKNRIKWLKKLL